MVDTLTLGNPVFAAFTFYSAILLLKVVFMSFWTARWRIPLQIFPSPEDYELIKNEKEKEKKIREGAAGNPEIERVRRAHLNDLENILPFVLIGFFYVLCNPPHYAVLLFRIFTVARILHTIVYLNGIRQPSRALCFVVGATINIIMAVQIILKTKEMW